jgi:hypothetical protein
VWSAWGEMSAVCMYRFRAAEIASAGAGFVPCPFFVCANVTDAIKIDASRREIHFVCLMSAE